MAVPKYVAVFRSFAVAGEEIFAERSQICPQVNVFSCRNPWQPTVSPRRSEWKDGHGRVRHNMNIVRISGCGQHLFVWKIRESILTITRWALKPWRWVLGLSDTLWCDYEGQMWGDLHIWHGEIAKKRHRYSKLDGLCGRRDWFVPVATSPIGKLNFRLPSESTQQPNVFGFSSTI